MSTTTVKTVCAALPKELKGVLPPEKVLEAMPAELVEEFGAFVFENDKGEVKIAATNPDDVALRRFVKGRFGEKVSWFLAEKEDLFFILKNYKRDFKDEISRLSTPERGVNGNIVEIVDRIIKFALTKKASDIHIEPLKNEVAVRFRMDGILQKAITLPMELHAAIVSRLKILSNLKIDEHRRPQDGRIEFEKISDMSLRVSTIPTLHGEKIALRILDDSNKNLSIEDLGFSQAHKEILLKNSEKPFGMIVTSGPTGAGKTTTLYGLLSMLKKEGMNISTLEDPVEYALTGINQIQVDTKAGLTFATGLRALLRQDPDVIMVGEIRDSETAVMAANAALTGHLVFTTMHTNDAPSAITRFLEMKVEDFVVASTVNLLIAQRLVRKICKACAKEDKLSKTTLKKIDERDDVVSRLATAKKDMEQIGKMSFLQPQGCSLCLGTGYNGRVGIFEMLEIDKNVHRLIMEHATAERIKIAVSETGFKDMIDDGIGKVFAGVTTFEEIIRATRNT